VTQMTPGQLLKATREAGPMSLDDIAKQLRLSVDTVCDIERDDYAKIGVRTFVRGYLCSYARLVSVSEAQILEALDASGLMPSDTHSLLPRIEGAPVMNVTHQHFRKLNPRLISIVCISALTLIILIAWLHTPKDINTVKLKTQNNSLALSPPFLAPAPTTTSTVAITKPVVVKTQTVKKEIKKENKKETTNVANANGFVVRPNVALHTTYTIKPATTN